MNRQLVGIICSFMIVLSTCVVKAEAVNDSVKNIEAKALAGDAKAQFELAKMYELGKAGGKPDFASALSWYEEAARNGLKVASYRIKMLNQP